LVIDNLSLLRLGFISWDDSNFQKQRVGNFLFFLELFRWSLLMLLEWSLLLLLGRSLLHIGLLTWSIIVKLW